jgi:hypothetical protein
MNGQVAIKKVTLKKYVSLYLIFPIKTNHLTNPTPQDMAPPLPKVANVFPQPTGLPLSFSIEHTIDLIPTTSFPNAPSYCLTPQEADVIECQPDQIMNAIPTPPSSSPCVYPSFRTPKWVSVPVVFANMVCTPTQMPTYYNTFPSNSYFFQTDY